VLLSPFVTLLEPAHSSFPSATVLQPVVSAKNPNTPPALLLARNSSTICDMKQPPLFAKLAALLSSGALLSAYIYDRAGGNLLSGWVTAGALPTSSEQVPTVRPEVQPAPASSSPKKASPNLPLTAPAAASASEHTRIPNWAELIGRSLSARLSLDEDRTNLLGAPVAPADSALEAASHDPIELELPKPDSGTNEPGPNQKKLLLLPGSKSGILVPAEEFSSPR
jgi:hypothetical protein